LRRSLRRSLELIGGTALFALMLFLALALASYADRPFGQHRGRRGPVENWMGCPAPGRRSAC
jgi:S-DNA-T family DNA segregation ATPase FtsK/SpoIIIE